MDILRKNPTNRNHFNQKRTLSMGIFGQYHNYLRAVLQKFSFLNPEILTRHQAMHTLGNLVTRQQKMCSLRSAGFHSQVPFLLKRRMNMTQLAGVMPKYRMTTIPAMPIRDIQGNVNAISKETVVSSQGNENDLPKQTKTPSLLQDVKDSKEKPIEPAEAKDNLKKLFHKQHRNMQTIKEHHRRTKQRMEKLRIRETIYKLLKLQQEKDETSCSPQEKTPLNTNGFLRHLETSKIAYSAPRFKHKMSDFGQYTFTNAALTDYNNLKKCTAPSLKPSPVPSSLELPRLDQRLPRKTTQPYSKESAIYLLCKNVLKPEKY